MNRKAKIALVGFFIAGIFAMPLSARASGCTEICGGNPQCVSNCAQVIASMSNDIDTQVCKAYLAKPGQETLGLACHSTLEQVIGRMMK